MEEERDCTRERDLRGQVMKKGIRVGLLSLLGTSHWCTCPGIQCSTGSHPEPLVPAPQLEPLPWPGTSGSTGCQGRWRWEATRKTVPGTWRHCEQSTAGHENHLLLVGSPAEKKEKKVSRSIWDSQLQYHAAGCAPQLPDVESFPV